MISIFSEVVLCQGFLATRVEMVHKITGGHATGQTHVSGLSVSIGELNIDTYRTAL